MSESPKCPDCGGTLWAPGLSQRWSCECCFADFVLDTTPASEDEDEEPEEDIDNPTYMRGWHDAKADSVDPRSKRPCPGCVDGEAPVLLDEDGTLSSVSGKPGRPGHGAGDAYWFCEDFASQDEV